MINKLSIINFKNNYQKQKQLKNTEQNSTTNSSVDNKLLNKNYLSFTGLPLECFKNQVDINKIYEIKQDAHQIDNETLPEIKNRVKEISNSVVKTLQDNTNRINEIRTNSQDIIDAAIKECEASKSKYILMNDEKTNYIYMISQTDDRELIINNINKDISITAKNGKLLKYLDGCEQKEDGSASAKEYVIFNENGDLDEYRKDYTLNSDGSYSVGKMFINTSNQEKSYYENLKKDANSNYSIETSISFNNNHITNYKKNNVINTKEEMSTIDEGVGFDENNNIKEYLKDYFVNKNYFTMQKQVFFANGEPITYSEDIKYTPDNGNTTKKNICICNGKTSLYYEGHTAQPDGTSLNKIYASFNNNGDIDSYTEDNRVNPEHSLYEGKNLLFDSNGTVEIYKEGYETKADGSTVAADKEIWFDKYGNIVYFYQNDDKEK